MNPELLLPAGDFPALKSAVENGADAVYVGAVSFSARRGAVNFSETELLDAIQYAHERSVRVYLALNTLIADEELIDALATATHAAASGIDAIIVQDSGLARLIHEVLPAMALHASTQMSIADESAVAELGRIGIRRIILPRELDLPEIARLTSAAHENGMQTEMFIHGALCVCFSGQCLFSSLMGGRSGNRGACAQPCRLSYRISVDGRLMPASACLSPKDQAFFGHIPEILATKVDSLKVEGRMRSATYVGHTAAVYRSLLDNIPVQQKIEERLLLAFNRGGTFTERALSGKKDRSFLSGSTTGSHGVFIGMVSEVRPQAGILAILLNHSEDSLGKGDILSVRRTDLPNELNPSDHQSEIASAPIGTMVTTGQQLQVRGFHPDVLARLHRGDFVYRMNDAKADQMILSVNSRRTSIDCQLMEEDKEVHLTACVSAGPFTGICATASVPVDVNIGQPLLAARAEQQLEKTGGTPYKTQSLHVPEPVNLSIAGLNQLRRSVLFGLGQKLTKINRQFVPAPIMARVISQLNAELKITDTDARITISSAVRPLFSAFFHQWPDQDDPLSCGADAYLLPAAGLESKESRRQLTELRSTEPDALLILVLPPTATGLQAQHIRQWQTDGTIHLFDRISGGHPGISVIAKEQGIGFETDATANVYNHLSLQQSIDSGSALTCLSPELSEEQLFRLASYAGQATNHHRLEWPIYGRQRLMYSAFCPIGFNQLGCSLCDGHQYALVDQKERLLPLLLHPPYCNSTILHAEEIKLPANLAVMINLTPARLRLLFANEKQHMRKKQIDRFRSLFSQSSQK